MPEPNHLYSEDIIKHGFTRIPNLLIRSNHYLPEEQHLGPSEQIVLHALLSFMFEASSEIRPSKATLQIDAGIASDTTITAALKGLERKGFLTWKKGKSGVANSYDLSPYLRLMNEMAKTHKPLYARKTYSSKPDDSYPKPDLSDDF